ncbi:hypothetical protein, partial [Escherichia coli]|uniref:hypothetical protein n=1 Tax=Escherichia coli TaxID=562 RepID=UPI001BFC6D6C
KKLFRGSMWLARDKCLDREMMAFLHFESRNRATRILTKRLRGFDVLPSGSSKSRTSLETQSGCMETWLNFHFIFML